MLASIAIRADDNKVIDGNGGLESNLFKVQNSYNFCLSPKNIKKLLKVRNLEQHTSYILALFWLYLKPQDLTALFKKLQIRGFGPYQLY